MVERVDRVGEFSSPLETDETDLASRVLRVGVGLAVLGVLSGALVLLEWSSAALVGVAFTLGSTQIAGY